mgnify:CR=1 FL=1|tara:strand:- start:136 stop:708 length:573 start_codon:yes stop_codon:yes gene_type:complete
MFAQKKNYFLIIESIKDFDLKNIKNGNKFSIIYRNQKNPEKKNELLKFRKECRLKFIKFFIANDIKLALFLNADGIYVSSFNRSLKFLNYKKSNFQIIGSAHNIKEISLKCQQGCSSILFSKLFLVSYDKNAQYLGINRFNNFLKLNKNLIPLGGINLMNLNSLRNVRSTGFALLSEIKKKPAKIINRLF